MVHRPPPQTALSFLFETACDACLPLGSTLPHQCGCCRVVVVAVALISMRLFWYACPCCLCCGVHVHVTVAVVCRMPKEPGTCRGYFRRWFYDAEVQRCRQFVYGGCNGNSNNFESEQDCQEYCKKDGATTTASLLPFLSRIFIVQPFVEDWVEVCRHRGLRVGHHTSSFRQSQRN